jgi:hypothetical protein
MSTFLGKIHYWLYNKIQLHEDLLEEVLKFAEERNINAEELKMRTYEKYGYPERKPLEEVVNQGNIHGWLQMKIQSVEYRTAAVVTELINKYDVKIQEIADIYYKSGAKTMESIVVEDFSLKNLYTLIFDFMLEGMPCDNVNKVVLNSENEFSWQTTTCLHREYWDGAQGNVSNFYILRGSWINGFLKASRKSYSYRRTPDGLNTISAKKH